jgi:hypothetical protein
MSKQPTPTNRVEKRSHYFLFAGKIIFVAEGEDDIGSAEVNSVVMSDDGNLPIALLGRAQQTLQMQFHEQANDPTKLKIINVVITAIMPLGKFTPSEFNALPPGMKVQEKTPEAKAAVKAELDEIAKTVLHT